MQTTHTTTNSPTPPPHTLDRNLLGPTVPEGIYSLLGFPKISRVDFDSLPLFARSALITRNRIVNTDTYNRTMTELSALREWEPEVNRNLVGDAAVYTFSMRHSPFNYIIAAGVQEMLDALSALPIAQSELDFAKEYYKDATVPFFHPEMWQAVIDNGGQLPFEVHGVEDGTVLLPGEPFLTIKGPAELVAHFEQVFHRMFYPSMVATRAHVIRQILGDPDRFIEVGKRGTPTEETHHIALRAMYIGGGFTRTSNDAARALLEAFKDSGTMGHRYVQSMPSVEAAFRHAMKSLPALSLLVDLVDSYEGLDLSVRLKQEDGEARKPAFPRLDSGEILKQVRYYLKITNELGLTDPARDSVVVEGIESIDDIAEIEAMISSEFGEEAKKRVRYGAGGLLVSEQVSRKDASTGLKLSRCTMENGKSMDTLKLSNSPGKESTPGAPRLVIIDGNRIVAQLGEQLEGMARELFVPLLINGRKCISEEIPASMRKIMAFDFEAIFDGKPPSKAAVSLRKAIPSQETARLTREVRERYGKAAV
jgi:nicotinic acid phosphoribosyltransferase